MKRYTFNSKNYRRLDLIPVRQDALLGSLKLTNLDSQKSSSIFLKYDDPELKSFDLTKNTDYIIEFHNSKSILAYLCASDDILETGVKFLEFNEDISSYTHEDICQIYDEPYRNQFHFAPFKNWMNDPNGLCYFEGLYHLFYQFNPLEQSWDNMYWGHAVSKDLIHWKHLAIALKPQIELLNNPDFRGGAFSGSALVHEGLMKLFLTRSYSRSGHWGREWQVSLTSENGIDFSPETLIIEETPEGVGMDFRDPSIYQKDDKFYLFLGCAHYDRPAVICYSSKDLKNWDYLGPILELEDSAYEVVECPDVYEIDGKFVLVVGFVNKPGEDNRPKRRDSRYYIGEFKGGKFEIESSGLLDYGKDYYAVQSYVLEDRIVSLGWNSDDLNRHVPSGSSSNGSFSLPREMTLVDNKLYSYPVKEVDLLSDEIIYRVSGQDFTIDKHKDNRYRLDLDFISSTEFTLSLCKNLDDEVFLSYEGESFKLISSKGDEAEAKIAFIEDLTVFVDRALVEVFVNKGEYVFTRRYYLENPIHEVSASFAQPKLVKDIKLTRLKFSWWNN